MLLLQCPKCGQTLQVDPKFAGQTVRCPKCSALLRAPAAAIAVTAKPAPPPVLPAPPASMPAPAPARPTPADLACDVFISYRREDGEAVARMLADRLKE